MMNKKLITLAVAAAMAAPLAVSAETTLYGRMDTAIQYTDLSDIDGTEAWDVDTGTTRIGVKGSEDLGNGLKAIFQAEWQFTSSEGGSTASGDANFDNRLAYGGLSGNFGTITIGRQWTPYYGAVNKTDVFNNPGGSNATDCPWGYCVSANQYSLGPSRAGNQVIYSTPNFNGFSGAVSLQMDRDTGGTESEGVDVWNVALNYNNGPLSIGASYLEEDDDVGFGDELWGLAASYNFGMFKIIGQYENLEDDYDFDADSWALVGEAYFGNNTVRLLYGEVDGDDDGDLDVYGISLQHNFSSRTRVYVEYVANEWDSGSDDADFDQFNLGLRHDF